MTAPATRAPAPERAKALARGRTELEQLRAEVARLREALANEIIDNLDEQVECRRCGALAYGVEVIPHRGDCPLAGRVT
jgi:hypothetical protein